MATRTTPKTCLPACAEKRDFMDHNPPRSVADFYAAYDPMVGVGTALVLTIFFVVITIRSFIRWATMKVHIYKFERDKLKAQRSGLLQRASDVVDV